MEMNWRFLIGASILSAGLLFKVGAPIVPIVVGVAAAAGVNWGLRRSRARRSRSLR
jgi:hypothetical protein